MLNTLNGVQLGTVCGFEAFRIQAKVIALDGIFNLLFIPLGAFFYGVSGAIFGSVIASFLGFFVKQWAMHNECTRSNIKVSHRNISSELPALWKFVLPAILVGVSIQPFEWFARLMLVRQPNGFAELGVFTAVYTWAQIILFLPGQISGPIMPIISNLLAMKQIKQLKKALNASQLLVFVLAILTAIPLALLAPYILRVYGSGFASGRLTLLIMICAYLIGVVTQISRAFFAASNRMWLQMITTTLWGILLVVGCKIFINKGSIGLAASYLSAFMIFTFLQLAIQAVIIKKSNTEGNRQC